MSTPEGKRPIVQQSTSPLSDILKPMVSGKALLDRKENNFQQPSSDKEQAYWDKIRLSITIAESMPPVEFSASPVSLPVPYLELVEQHTVQNIVVRLVSILDDRLKTILCSKQIRVNKPVGLKTRIDAASNNGFITNGADLQDLRETRNEISHELTPKLIKWKDVHEAADHVERALCDLGIVNPAPKFSAGSINLTKLEISQKKHEYGRREVTLDIMADGKPYCQYVWPYVYFENSAWSPD